MQLLSGEVILFLVRKNLKIPKRQSEAINQRRIES